MMLTHKVPKTTIAKFANTVDPDETAHKKLRSFLDLQCVFNKFNFLKFCRSNFCRLLFGALRVNNK